MYNVSVVASNPKRVLKRPAWKINIDIDRIVHTVVTIEDQVWGKSCNCTASSYK